MSEGPTPSGGAHAFRGAPEDASSSAGVRAPLRGREDPDPGGPTRSWKIITGVVFILTFFLVGLTNHVWLRGTGPPRRSRRFYAALTDYGSRLYNYQARLWMPREQRELLKTESQTLEHNFREILSLAEQIAVLKALLRDLQHGQHGLHAAGEPPGEPPGAPGHAELLEQETSNLVNYILKRLREDQVQMADYALKSAGAAVIEAGTSESYRSDRAKLSWHGVGFLGHATPPDAMLQPDVHPGKCWAFPGSRGHALVRLATQIVPTAVTLEHIPQKVSPSGSVASAPKEFSVHGIVKGCDGGEIFLGQFLYNTTGAAVQTFALQHEVSESLLCVKLKVLSNWGHPKYTCVYRFRVHGAPAATPGGAGAQAPPPQRSGARTP